MATEADVANIGKMIFKNGWAKDMIEGSWLGDGFTAEERHFTASAGD